MPEQLTIFEMCAKCGLEPRIPNYSYCRTCTRAQNRESYHKHKASRLPKVKAHRLANVERIKEWHRQNYRRHKAAGTLPPPNPETRRRYLEKLKREVFSHYGGAICACCGVDDSLHFLTLDHINSDGKAHRDRVFGKGIPSGGGGMYRWLKIAGFPQDLALQVLCMSCNLAKSLSGINKCPHQIQREALWQSFIEHVTVPIAA